MPIDDEEVVFSWSGAERIRRVVEYVERLMRGTTGAGSRRQPVAKAFQLVVMAGVMHHDKGTEATKAHLWMPDGYNDEPYGHCFDEAIELDILPGPMGGIWFPRDVVACMTLPGYAGLVPIANGRPYFEGVLATTLTKASSGTIIIDEGEDTEETITVHDSEYLDDDVDAGTLVGAVLAHDQGGGGALRHRGWEWRAIIAPCP